MSALAQRSLAYLVAGGLVAALLFWTFGKVDGWLASHDAEVTASSQAQLAAHPAVLRWRAKLFALQLARSREREAWRDSANFLLARGDTNSLEGVRAILLARTGEARSCGLALVACEARARMAEAESDSLVARLSAQVKVRDHPCGLWLGAGVAVGWKSGSGLDFALGCRVVRLPWP